MTEYVKFTFWPSLLTRRGALWKVYQEAFGMPSSLLDIVVYAPMIHPQVSYYGPVKCNLYIVSTKAQFADFIIGRDAHGVENMIKALKARPLSQVEANKLAEQTRKAGSP